MALKNVGGTEFNKMYSSKMDIIFDVIFLIVGILIFIFYYPFPFVCLISWILAAFLTAIAKMVYNPMTINNENNKQ